LAVSSWEVKIPYPTILGQILKNCFKRKGEHIMRKMSRTERKKVVGGGLNWQCRKCGRRGWGVLSSFIHNMIPGHHSFKTW